MSNKIEDIEVKDAEILDFTYPLLKVKSVEIYSNRKLIENIQGIDELSLSYVDNGEKLKLMIKL
jgi:hypothetical protein